MNRYGKNRTNSERASKGITLRLNVDTLAMLDTMKEKLGMSKTAIIDRAVKGWHAVVYPHLKMASNHIPDNKDDKLLAVDANIVYINKKKRSCDNSFVEDF